MAIQALDDLEQLPTGTTGRLWIGPNCRTCNAPRARPIDPNNERPDCTSCRALTRTLP